MLAPAAGYLLAGPVDAFTDRHVHLPEVLGAGAEGLVERVRAVMADDPHDVTAHRTAMAAVERALRRFLPVDPEGELVNAVVAYIEDDSDVLVARNQVLTGVLLVDLDATVVGFPKALFPALAVTRFGGGAGTVGLLYAAVAVGGVAAAALSGPLTRLRRQGRLAVLAVAAMSVCFAALGVVRVLWPALVLLAVAGAADAALGVVRGTLLQVLTSDRLRGRVNSVRFVVGAGGPSLGDVETGGLAALTSPAVAASPAASPAWPASPFWPWRCLRYGTTTPAATSSRSRPTSRWTPGPSRPDELVRSLRTPPVCTAWSLTAGAPARGLALLCWTGRSSGS